MLPLWSRRAAIGTVSLCCAVLTVSAQDKPATALTSPSTQYGAKRVEFTVAGHQAFVVLPNKSSKDGSKPWLWYAPTFHRTSPDERHAWMFTRLLDKGFAIAGVDVGESYGSPEGSKIFSKFHSTVVGKYDLSPKACLLGISRGGLMVYNWAKDNAERVQCIGGIYPFVDLRSYRRGFERIAKPYSLSVAEFERQISAHNPIDNLGPLAEHRVPIMHLHGSIDEVLPLERNSGELGRRYAALGGYAEILIVYGKGHEVDPKFWQSQTLVDFFLSRGRNAFN